MADFCKQCTKELFGDDMPNDFQRSTPSDPPLEQGEGYGVLCEGCGFTLVTDDGTCITDCFHHHNADV